MLKPAVALFLITVVSAFLLGLAYDVTEKPIEHAKEAEKQKALSAILPEAVEFKDNKLPNDGSAQIDGALITEVLTAYDSAGGVIGYIFSVESKGYGGTLGIMAAISDTPEGAKIEGVKVITSSETPGLGANASKSSFTDQFIGKGGSLSVTKNKAGADETAINAISSATITSKAVTDCVNAACQYFEKFLRRG